MISKIKKPVSILLSIIMVFSLFTIVPFTASAADSAIQIGNSDASGAHWSYVASTKTLTLNGYNFSGSSRGIEYTGSGTLSIVLVGDNSIDAKNRLAGIYINSNNVGLRISGDGSLDLKSENECGIYTRGNMEFAGGTINISGDVGIYNHDHHITISGSEIYATGSNCGIYTKNGGMLYITGGKLVATGGSQAIKNDNTSATKNNMTGTGWTNTEGTEGEATIPVSTEGQKLTYKKVQFPAQAVASVTSGGTTTNYSELSTALTNWTNGSTLTLLADVTTSSTIGVSGTKTLDLNGYGIKTAGGVAITVNNGADLTMKDSAPTRTGTGTNRPNGVEGGYLTGFTGSNSACVVINAGKFTMDGGSITGNIGSGNGAGVMINSSANLVMNGGSITNNEAGVGAGIYCYGKVTMTGGIVSDNVSTYTPALSGGMLIHGSLTMTGGTVTRNTIGVRVWQRASVVNLSGNARITDNTVNGTAYGNLDMSGGEASQNCVKVTGTLGDDALIGITMKTPGVFTNSTDISLNDASKFFSDNSSYTVGKNAAGQLLLGVPRTVTWKMDDGSVIDTTTVANGGVPTHADPTKADDDNAYTFTGWTPALAPVTADATYTAQFTAAPYVASVTSNGTTTKYTAFGTAVSNWTDGSTLTLLANVTTSSVIYFESGVKTLDLNGYGIKNTSANYVNNNSVIYIRRSGTQLTLQDSRPNETTHYFTAPAGNAGLATDISDIDSGDQQSFHGGYLTGGNCFSGGGIRVDDGANLIMTGGTIIGNRGTYGGGIDVEKSGSAGGSATISGGAIMYNYGTDYNGAIHTNGANYVSVSNCKITNNYAEQGAGGAYKSSINGGFSGNLIIKDNKTGNTECNVLIESNQYISLTSALGENASIGITMNNPGVFTNSSTTDYNVASKFTSDNVNYKVVKNAGGQLELVYKFFAGHTVTLGGDIGVNFYLNPAVLDNYNGTKTVKFTCDGEETTVDVPATPTADGYKVTRNVVAAQMAHTITATLYVGGEAVDTDEYSVQEYAETVYANPADYDNKNRPDELKALAKALLNYGAMAQTVFADALKEHPAPANTTVGAWSNAEYAAVDGNAIGAKINGSASNLEAVATQLGAKYFTSSLIYLSKNTLRIYFTPVEYGQAMPNASAYTGNKSNYYYFKDHADIPAAELDNQQNFKVGGTEFTYSALDYAKAVVESNNMNDTQKNLARSLFLYNQAANAYFD